MKESNVLKDFEPDLDCDNEAEDQRQFADPRLDKQS